VADDAKGVAFPDVVDDPVNDFRGALHLSTINASRNAITRIKNLLRRRG
jgi:hypothetical protein